MFTKVYDIKSAYLIKSVTRIDDLSNGYTQVTIMNLYVRQRAKDLFLHINKITTDPKCNIVDLTNWYYEVPDDFVKTFNHKYNELDLMSGSSHLKTYTPTNTQE